MKIVIHTIFYYCIEAVRLVRSAKLDRLRHLALHQVFADLSAYLSNDQFHLKHTLRLFDCMHRANAPATTNSLQLAQEEKRQRAKSSRVAPLCPAFATTGSSYTGKTNGSSVRRRCRPSSTTRPRPATSTSTILWLECA